MSVVNGQLLGPWSVGQLWGVLWSNKTDMARTAFENLRVYRLAERLADEVWEVVVTWDAFARATVGEQLVTAADSVGANIAEGAGRGTYKENRRYVRIARGSLNETQHFLRRAYTRKLMTQKHVTTLKPIIDELAPSLNAYLASIGPNAKAMNIKKRTGHPATD